MEARAELTAAKAMATRWRQRRMCVLSCGDAYPAALRSVSAAGAFVETNARPALGDAVSLAHPEAGTIPAHVNALHTDGIALRFAADEAACAFALAAIAADMSRPL